MIVLGVYEAGVATILKDQQSRPMSVTSQGTIFFSFCMCSHSCAFGSSCACFHLRSFFHTWYRLKLSLHSMMFLSFSPTFIDFICNTSIIFILSELGSKQTFWTLDNTSWLTTETKRKCLSGITMATQHVMSRARRPSIGCLDCFFRSLDV